MALHASLCLPLILVLAIRIGWRRAGAGAAGSTARPESLSELGGEVTRRLPYSPSAICFCVALAASAAGAELPGNFDALKASAEITEDLARLDLDAASEAAAKL